MKNIHVFAFLFAGANLFLHFLPVIVTVAAGCLSGWVSVIKLMEYYKGQKVPKD